jgi:hypothetical protein
VVVRRWLNRTRSRVTPGCPQIRDNERRYFRAASDDRCPTPPTFPARLVARLAGVALEDGNVSGVSIAGVPPKEMDGVWGEGFIVNSTRDVAADTDDLNGYLPMPIPRRFRFPSLSRQP